LTRRGLLGGDDEALLRRLAGVLMTDLDGIADEVTRRVLERHTALAAVDDADAVAAVRHSTTANIGAFLSALAFGVPAGSVDPPQGALELVERVAAESDRLPVLLRA